QGLGGGGLVVLAQSTIGDVVPPVERGRYQAWLSGTYALAALTGPITGGYLTAWFGWRSVFAVSLPLALIALLLTRRILGGLPRPTRVHALDYPSVLILAVAWRSVNEEATLRAGLDGYDAYAARVRYRFVPLLW
ncbi:MAG: MFS transporter, partial [Burkholderiales bacterium]|nr:MFS transporter [Burkholderiales bacterium]